uniref:non-specific serine/threonine protein kinase n=1 Tax=Spongospora subterranea TaxID=70186 RepID=A0A0H5R787_9EUKA|eukprot:CRZ09617.1 hypothetical protein [Spongospora subterranea]
MKTLYFQTVAVIVILTISFACSDDDLPLPQRLNSVSNEYSFTERIDSGKWYSLYTGKSLHSPKSNVVIKVIKKGSYDVFLEDALREIEIMTRLQGSVGIPKLLDVSYSLDVSRANIRDRTLQEDEAICIVMDETAGWSRSMSWLIESIDEMGMSKRSTDSITLFDDVEKLLLKYTMKVLQILSPLQRQGIVHGDVSALNVLASGDPTTNDWDLRLSEFGRARLSQNYRLDAPFSQFLPAIIDGLVLKSTDLLLGVIMTVVAVPFHNLVNIYSKMESLATMEPSDGVFANLGRFVSNWLPGNNVQLYPEWSIVAAKSINEIKNIFDNNSVKHALGVLDDEAFVSSVSTFLGDSYDVQVVQEFRVFLNQFEGFVQSVNSANEVDQDQFSQRFASEILSVLPDGYRSHQKLLSVLEGYIRRDEEDVSIIKEYGTLDVYAQFIADLRQNNPRSYQHNLHHQLHKELQTNVDDEPLEWSNEMSDVFHDQPISRIAHVMWILTYQRFQVDEILALTVFSPERQVEGHPHLRHPEMSFLTDQINLAGLSRTVIGADAQQSDATANSSDEIIPSSRGIENKISGDFCALKTDIVQTDINSENAEKPMSSPCRAIWILTGIAVLVLLIAIIFISITFLRKDGSTLITNQV